MLSSYCDSARGDIRVKYFTDKSLNQYLKQLVGLAIYLLSDVAIL